MLFNQQRKKRTKTEAMKKEQKSAELIMRVRTKYLEIECNV